MQPKMLDNNTCPVINEKLHKNGGLSLLPLFNRGWLAHNPQVSAKVIDSVPYQLVQPEYTVPASNPVHSTPLFRTEKNTGRTGLVPVIPANFGQ